MTDLLTVEDDDLDWVYFVEMRRPNLIKVGFATDTANRMSSLRTSCPFDLEMLQQFRGSKDDERKIQTLLKPHHYNREWFRPHEDIFDLLDDIFEFQVDTLAYGPTSNAPSCLADNVHVPLTGFWEWRQRAIEHANA